MGGENAIHGMSKIIPPNPQPAAVELLDKVRICERLNLSPRALEYLVQDGTFPPPVRVGRKVFWSEIAVRRWQQRLFAAQEAWHPD